MKTTAISKRAFRISIAFVSVRRFDDIKLSRFNHLDSAYSDQKVILDDKDNGSFHGCLAHSTQTFAAATSDPGSHRSRHQQRIPPAYVRVGSIAPTEVSNFAQTPFSLRVD